MLRTLAATTFAMLASVAGHAHHRHHHRPPPMHSAVASYYDDAGSTACGFHATYGFAHLGPGEGSTILGGLSCGTRIRFCARRCVTGTMDDHGPYIGGREFDLDEALKDAIGASDLGTVRYRLTRRR